MDILNILGNFTGNFGKEIFFWTAGAALSTYLVNELRKTLSSIVDGIVKKTRIEIASIEDENLREAARHIVRYVGTQFVDAPNDEKLQVAIKKMQEITPDIIVSDEKVKVLIESAYSDFKRELKNV